MFIIGLCCTLFEYQVVLVYELVIWYSQPWSLFLVGSMVDDLKPAVFLILFLISLAALTVKLDRPPGLSLKFI